MDKHILIVDDDKNILEMLETFLTGLGYDVSRAENGRDGLRQCVAQKPDLILMDIRMPMLDGLNALDLIKLAHLGHDIPVIIMSGTATGEAFDAAKKLGAKDCLVKPFNLSELGLKLEAMFHASSPESTARVCFIRWATPQLLNAQIAIREGQPTTVAGIAAALREIGLDLAPPRFLALCAELETLGRNGSLNGGFLLLKDMRAECLRALSG